MSGIQISGLLSNAAFDWKSVVDQLVQADSAPIATLNKEKASNLQKTTALGELKTSLLALQDSLQAMRSGNFFSQRTVSSDVANTTWKSSSAKGAPVGSYTVAVQHLATKSQVLGKSDIGQGLDDSSGLTLANLNTATPITAGTFSVNGAQITIDTTESLDDVFAKIYEATGHEVSGAYDPISDKISLTSSGGNVVLNATNDTSNFVGVMKLSNNGSATVTSSGSLGTLKTGATLANAGLKTSLTGQDASGNGQFAINGVAISYNINTDTLSAVISRINKAGAGVTASYDSANDRLMLVNNTTGDIGVGASDSLAGATASSGNLLAALGVTAASGSSLARGQNTIFTVNGGPPLSSTSTTLTEAAHGIKGLNVTVNTETTQTLQVESDLGTMQAGIQDFIDKFNSVQTYIEANTKVSVTGGAVSTSILSGNREVQAWAGKLESLAFGAVSGLTGSVRRLDDLGIDFNGTTGQLAIKDSGKLASALTDHPDNVEDFFLNGSTSFVAKMYGYLTTIMSSDSAQQSNLTKANTQIDEQITTLQSRLDTERQLLTSSFIKMQEAQSTAQSQSTYLTNAFFKNSSSN